MLYSVQSGPNVCEGEDGVYGKGEWETGKYRLCARQLLQKHNFLIKLSTNQLLIATDIWLSQHMATTTLTTISTHCVGDRHKLGLIVASE